jgi:hypothetical protein
MRYYADIKYNDINKIIKIDDWCYTRFKERTWYAWGFYKHSEPKGTYIRYHFQYSKDRVVKLTWLG